MLINLRTLHQPKSLREAAELLKRPGVYPLYGSGAAIVRNNSRDIEEAVDLAPLVPTDCKVEGNRVLLGAGATLETIATARPEFSSIIKADAPLMLRNTLTIGDMLLESRPDSLFLTLLYALEAEIVGAERYVM